MSTLRLGRFGGADEKMVALAIVGIVVVYLIAKKTLTAGAQAVGGVVSGNNALTQGTPYQGAGIFGTLGAAFNSASGGVLGNIGSSIGNGLYNLLNPGTGNAQQTAIAQGSQAVNRDQVVTDNPPLDLYGTGAADAPYTTDQADFGLSTDQASSDNWGF